MIYLTYVVLEFLPLRRKYGSLSLATGLVRWEVWWPCSRSFGGSQPLQVENAELGDGHHLRLCCGGISWWELINERSHGRFNWDGEMAYLQTRVFLPMKWSIEVGLFFEFWIAALQRFRISINHWHLPSRPQPLPTQKLSVRLMKFFLGAFVSVIYRCTGVTSVRGPVDLVEAACILAAMVPLSLIVWKVNNVSL